MALSRHSSPQLNPSGHLLRPGVPEGKGTFSRLRGRLNSTVLPVVVSTLATIIVSGRMPIRSSPASEPISRTFTRDTPAHGSAFSLLARAVLVSASTFSWNTVSTRSRPISAYRPAW